MHSVEIEGFELSPQQRRIWRLQQEDGSSAYVAQGAAMVSSEVNPERWREALCNVVSRYEILRTAFPRLPGMTLPVQVIAAPGEPRVETLLAGAADVVPGEILPAMEVPAEAGIGVCALHLAVVPLGPNRQRLLLAAPAMCTDAAGIAQLFVEICRICDDGETVDGEQQEVVQYADLAQALNDLLRSDDAKPGRDHWTGQALLAPGTVRLPFAREVAGGPFSPVGFRWHVADETLTLLDTAAERYRLRPGALLLAVWQTLLARLTGSWDVPVGVLVDGRSFSILHGAVGLFARSLPLTVRLHPGQPLLEAAKTAEASMAEAEELENALDWDEFGTKDGGPAGVPFGFELRTLPPRRRIGGLELDVERLEACIDRYAARLSLSRGENGLEAEITGDGLGVGAAEAARLSEHFQALLDSAVGDPLASLESLELLSSSQRRQVVSSFNATWRDLSGDDRFFRIIEEQAIQVPDRVALIYGEQQLTYTGLMDRAHQLARYLRAAGVGPEVCVGVCVERSPEMVVTLLGVLAAGGAYLPLDPSHPADRLAFMLDDVGASVLVTQRALLPQLTHDGGRRVVCLEDEAEAIAAQPADEPAVAISPAGLAYVIYTSGSTGRPKGVMISHRAITNRLKWMQDALPLAPDDRVLQKTPITFDASLWELFVPLMAGAQLVLARPDGHRDGAYLRRAVMKHEITVLQLVPSQLRLFLEDEGEAARCRSLRRVFCGGEALTAELVQRFQRLLASDLVNLYGPTESSIDASWWVCAEPSDTPVVPIGCPLANVQVYLLDSSLRPVPQGLAGELYIGGVGLARGYQAHPALTAERFLPDLFGGEPGGRLYRTGDLARHRTDGVLEFLGRLDHQVKVRGIRIELGEIEGVLERHPGIRAAVVMLRQDQPGIERLVAYYLPATGEPLTREELARSLAETLPAAMIPSAFVPLESIPLGPSGKVDRSALPVPEMAKETPGPVSKPVEEILTGIVAGVLKIEHADPQASYLQLGGHSLLATSVVSRIREAFGVDLALRSLFETSSLATLAERIELGLAAAEGVERPPLGPIFLGENREAPLSFAQQRLWFTTQLTPENSLFNTSSALHLAGQLDPRLLRRSLEEVVRRHEVLRTTFPARDGRPVQAVGPAWPVPLPVIDLTSLPEGARRAEEHRLALEDARRPFELERGPLLRATLVRLATHEHVALYAMHHIVSDGWSIRILVEEVSAIYLALSEGRPPRLPELPLQYADFAVWQRRWLQGDALGRLLAWWRERLAGSPAAIRLPTNRPRPPVPTGRGARQTFVLEGDLVGELRSLARQEKVTLFMVLLAVFQALLHILSDEEDIVVGTDVAGRDQVQVEGLIGFFVNQLPLRARIAEGMTFRGLLQQVREVTLGAYSHQDVPFDKLVEDLRPVRSAEHAPLFQVKINLQNVESLGLKLPGLSVSSLPIDRSTAQLDLILNLEETAQAIRATLEYNTDLFHLAMARKLCEHFQTLLRLAVAAPGAKLSDFRQNVLEAERQQTVIQGQMFSDARREKLRGRIRQAPSGA